MRRERGGGTRRRGGRRLAIDGCEHHRQEWRKGKWPGLNARVYYLNWPSRAGRKGKEGGRAWRGSRWRLIGRSRGGGGKEGEGIETDQWGRRVSESKEKGKGDDGHGLLRGGGRRAAGPLGRKVSEVSFLFFLFLFQTLFKSTF
jgi:hypothetical protein